MKCIDWPHFSPRSSSITCRCCTLRGGRPWPSARHTAHGQNATAVMQYLSPAITNHGTRLIPHSPMKRETAYVAGYDISRRPLLIGTVSFVSEHALIIPALSNPICLKYHWFRFRMRLLFWAPTCWRVTRKKCSNAHNPSATHNSPCPAGRSFRP